MACFPSTHAPEAQPAGSTRRLPDRSFHPRAVAQPCALDGPSGRASFPSTRARRSLAGNESETATRPSTRAPRGRNEASVTILLGLIAAAAGLPPARREAPVRSIRLVLTLANHLVPSTRCAAGAGTMQHRWPPSLPPAQIRWPWPSFCSVSSSLPPTRAWRKLGDRAKNLPTSTRAQPIPAPSTRARRPSDQWRICESQLPPAAPRRNYRKSDSDLARPCFPSTRAPRGRNVSPPAQRSSNFHPRATWRSGVHDRHRRQ